MITAIQKVGVLFEEKKYYLPQLIASAETMEKAINYLEPMLIKDDEEEKATIIMATVEGDIHDIGKNLVVLMLKNYGYRVIDLGKDVSAECIIETAVKEHAAIIGLSALMTTTMMRMRDVVELAQAKHCSSKDHYWRCPLQLRVLQMRLVPMDIRGMLRKPCILWNDY